MPTLQQFSAPSDDDQDEGAAPTAPSDSDGDESSKDGGDPKQAIGFIPAGATPKVKTFLLAAKQFLIDADGAADRFRAWLGKSKDHVQAIALLVAKTVDNLEKKLGPLTDQEHDQVSLVITGWLVSSLQHMGMPGLDTEQGRHDLIGRILQTIDKATQRGSPAPGGAPQGTLPQMQPDEPETDDNPQEEQMEPPNGL